MSWKLVHFDNEAIAFTVAQRHTINELLDPKGPVFELCQQDDELTENVLADLDRVGARYAEFIGGTIVCISDEGTYHG